MATYALTRASDIKQLNSLDTQRGVINRAVAFFNLDSPEILEEPLGTSGYYTNFRDRPKGKWILANLQAGDTLIVVRIDRIGRTVKDILDTVERLVSRGVRIIDLSDGGTPLDMNSAMGQAMVAMKAVFAQWERCLISERMREAAQYRRQNNKPRNGQPPFGQFRTGPKGNRRLEWDEQKLDQLMICAEMRVAGVGWEKIRDYCQRMEWKDQEGEEWWRTYHEPDTSLTLAQRNRYKRLQRAVTSLYRHLDSLPEPWQTRLRATGIPADVKLIAAKLGPRLPSRHDPIYAPAELTNDEIETATAEELRRWIRLRKAMADDPSYLAGLLPKDE